MKPVKMHIKAYEGGKHDPRINVFISNEKTTLKITGHDRLPHLMNKKGDGYERITWEKFRRILTDPV